MKAERRIAAVLLLSLLTAAFGVADRETGFDYGFSLFYLLPVTTAGWFLGRRAGIFLAFQAAGWWFWASAADYSLAPLIWNALTRFVMYVGFGAGAGIVQADRKRLKLMLERERTLSRTDSLTGLENGRAFREEIKVDLARAKRNDTPVTLAYLDLDDFKGINDHFGHAAGDDVLVKVADIMRDNLRRGDRVARLGGDEFAMLLWDVRPDAAKVVVQRVVDGILALREEYPGSILGASVGLVAAASGDSSVDDVLRFADQAMYQVKTSGKGRVQAFSPSAAN